MNSNIAHSDRVGMLVAPTSVPLAAGPAGSVMAPGVGSASWGPLSVMVKVQVEVAASKLAPG